MKTAAHTEAEPGRALTRSREKGRVQVLPAAVAAIAGHAAVGCYGVMGTAGRGLRGGVAELWHRDSSHRGVEVREVPDGLAVDVYVIVQYGTRITEVAHNLQQAVRFDVERSLGVPVVEVNVFVQGVHEDVNAE
ncbi:MAG: Asp23/Gls24 family envelope stress response protein [Candidatus Dormibacteraceae bacterium]